MEMRCPKHDRIFDTTTDSRKPGSGKSDDGKLAAMPLDGHPDCPKCQDDAKDGLSDLSAKQLQAALAAPQKARPNVVDSAQPVKRKIA